MILFDDGQTVYVSKDPEQIKKWAQANAEGRRRLKLEQPAPKKKNWLQRLFCR